VTGGPALIVIAGPTASGKSSLALALARQLGAEIVGADSQQVYRHFDVGTAKPSAEEAAAVPHHLVSVVDPHEAFSAARYQQLADAAIADIHSRGKRVIVVGGTGLYLRVLLHGVVAAVGTDLEVRKELEKDDDATLHARLKEVDPVTAAKLPVGDRVRIIRALEIHQVSGRAASAHRAEHAFAADRYRFRLWVLSPPREALYAAINARTRAMFEGALLDEVRSLVAAGYREAAAMRSVGYVEALAVVEGRSTREEAIAVAAQRTRHYAKRQLTWFRKEAGAQFLTPPWDLSALAADPL
jgi:tRNA dimethylallyltransferase